VPSKFAIHGLPGPPFVASGASVTAKGYPRQMPRLYVSSRGHAGVGFGCLGVIVLGVAYLILAMVLLMAAPAAVALFGGQRLIPI
jgi:hypothetical protein